jgi:hypothetical protein
MDNATFNSSAASFVTFPYNGFNYIDTTGAGAALLFRVGSTPTNALRLSSNNDISFYEDTGTTPKLFWDASAEALAVGGTNTFTSKIVASAANGTAYTSNSQLRISGGGTNNNRASILFSDDALSDGKISYYPHVTEASRLLSLSARTTESDFVITGAGNVGIGTSSPAFDLDILDTSTASNTGAGVNIAHATQPQLRFAQTTGNYRMYVGMRTNDLIIANDSGAEKVRFEQNGNVGIGTSSPARKLEVNTGSEGYIARFKGATSAVDIFAGNTGTFTGGLITTPTNTPLGFSTNTGTGDLIIDTSGNVGIGTTSPTQSLDTTGKIRIRDGGNTTIPSIQMGASGVDGLSLPSTNTVAFITNSSEHMRIDSSGSVGIGTSSPSEKLHVNSGTGNVPALFQSTDSLALITFKDNSTSTDVGVGAAGNNQVFYAGSERMRIDSSGNLLVGTTTSGATKLKVVGEASNYAGYFEYQSSGYGLGISNVGGSGSTTAIFFFNTNGAVGSISTSGSATAYNTSSDQRLKENIADANDAGSKIDAIQVRQYDWKADGSHQDYGMIAQELQAVAPEAVSGDADSEDMMGVDYSKLVPMLIKEIQSLRNRVAQLEE